MIFRIELRTHDPQIIEALTKVKGKTPYLVEKALAYFLATQTGKNTVRALSEEKEGKRGKNLSKEEKKEEKEIFLEKFL